MDELKAKVVEAKEEWNQAIFAFTEYTNGVLKRANEFINADLESTSSRYDSINLLQAELSEVVRKCKSIRSTIENRSNPDGDSSLCSVATTNVSEILREGSPLTLESGCEILCDEDDDSDQTRPKVFVRADVSGDGNPENLPSYKEAIGDDSDTASMMTENDYPPSYAAHPEYPSGAFDFSFSVKLTNKYGMLQGKGMKLDNVEMVFVSSTAFKKEDATFKPPCDGVYALNVECCQGGHGEMDVWLRSGSRISYVGRTKENMLQTSVMKVKMLTKDQSHWVEVRALKGDPHVNWCNFSGFLIAKRPTGVAAAPS